MSRQRRPATISVFTGELTASRRSRQRTLRRAHRDNGHGDSRNGTSPGNAAEECRGTRRRRRPVPASCRGHLPRPALAGDDLPARAPCRAAAADQTTPAGSPSAGGGQGNSSSRHLATLSGWLGKGESNAAACSVTLGWAALPRPTHPRRADPVVSSRCNATIELDVPLSSARKPKTPSHRRNAGSAQVGVGLNRHLYRHHHDAIARGLGIAIGLRGQTVRLHSYRVEGRAAGRRRRSVSCRTAATPLIAGIIASRSAAVRWAYAVCDENIAFFASHV